MFIEKPAHKHSYSCRKPIQGVGINDANYLTHYKDLSGKINKCPYYVVWGSILERCYSERMHSKHPTYKDCTVCDEWIYFSNFKQWMQSQIWEGMHIDKDLLIPGNKVYSPESCVFVTPSINSMLTQNKSNKGEYPIGVSYRRKEGKFDSSCNYKNKQSSLGYFSTPEEASRVYLLFKAMIISTAAESAPYLESGLLRHANMFISQAENAIPN